MTSNELLSCAMDIGEQMLICGAEVERVESSVRFICSAYGCRRADVFTITANIETTIEDAEGQYYTQSRRITRTRTDLDRLHALNDLSRQICAQKPDYAYVQQQLKSICAVKPYPLWLEALGSALIAFSFAIFFGGSWEDGLVASVMCFGLRYTTYLLQMARLNQIFVNIVSSFLMCSVALGLTRIGLGDDVNKIIIGNIMLLIPGIALTNSIRDLICGDIMTGIMRFFDAALVAAAIAAGYILAVHFMGGVL